MTEVAGQGLTVCVGQTRPIPLAAAFEVGAGKLVALVGPSGSGKSTLLRCIAGLHRPKRGRITCGGVPWLDTTRGIFLPPQKRSVGLVFQQYALFPHMTAVANVAAALDGLPRDARRERAMDFLRMVHLEGLEDRYPRTLSGGQQQRVALARALAREPSILLLDEPFSAVDRRTRRALQSEIGAIRGRVQASILLVTHDLDEASALADSIVVLDQGRVLTTGVPEDLLNGPVSPEVARALAL